MIKIKYYNVYMSPLHMQNIVFSNEIPQLKKKPYLNALLSDICIATSAAPTYLPAHYFETKNQNGEVMDKFNLVDGGVAANNPVPYISMQELQYNLWIIIQSSKGMAENCGS